MARSGVLRGAAAGSILLLGTVLLAPVTAEERTKATSGPAASVGRPSPLEAAQQVDALINGALVKQGANVAGLCSDEDFLRRVSLDIIGITPTPQEVTLFGFDSDPDKRARLVARLLESPEYGKNWARYWRDVIYLRATTQFGNIGRGPFEEWMGKQLQANEPWDKIATAMLTATGDVTTEGQTALFAVHQAEPEEVAAEASRIFLGIQLQCANCHDHPSDRWKREQFHEFAAFFPRVRFDRRMNTQPPTIQLVSVEGNMDERGDRFREMLADPEALVRQFDRNNDKKISREELQRQPLRGRGLVGLLDRVDTDKDGALSVPELKAIPAPMMRTGRGASEYYMPDLNNPQSRGQRVDPGFFLSGKDVARGLADVERRSELARQLTSVENPWFAKAFVNRMWGTLLGEAFFMPIDDIGPDREPSYPAALDTLAAGFAANSYDVKWLFQTITATEAYQRQTRTKDPKKTETFAHAIPTRLRADALYSSLLRVLGVEEPTLPERQRMQGGFRFGDQSPRGQFNQLFGFDPSTTPEELNGTVPQALFMMNNTQFQGLTRADGRTRLADLLRKYSDNKDAIIELYLAVHSREPSEKELQVCLEYLRDVGNRNEAYEDLMWSLVNSTEFLTKR